MGARGVEAIAAISKQRWLTYVALALMLTACGGSTQRGDEPGTGTGSGGNTANGGSAGTSTAPVDEPTPEWLTEVRLDDTFPWFLQSPGGDYGMLPASEDGVLHLTLEGAPIATTLSTHNHFDVVNRAHGVTFRARASAPVTLKVSVKSTLDADYYAARDEGHPWPIAPAPLTQDWATFELAFAEMQPAEVPVTDAGIGSFTIAFVIEAEQGPLELWLDDVRFF